MKPVEMWGLLGSVVRKALWASSVGAIALATASEALAQQRTFKLPAAEAAETIPEFAKQAELQIIAPAEQLDGIKTRAVIGRMDARTALRILITGTGLTVAADNGAIITLRMADKSNQSRELPASSDGYAPGRTSPKANRPIVEQVIVTATKTGGTDLQTTPV